DLCFGWDRGPRGSGPGAGGRVLAVEPAGPGGLPVTHVVQGAGQLVRRPVAVGLGGAGVDRAMASQVGTAAGGPAVGRVCAAPRFALPALLHPVGPRAFCDASDSHPSVLTLATVCRRGSALRRASG